MATLVVVGAQWGDEGKGKLVDYLTAGAEYVVRFQGGSNAGHTLVVDGVKTKLSLIPSGILRPGARCVIGAGAVINPTVLLREIDDLTTSGIRVDPSRLLVDRDAHLVMPYHALIDLAREEARGVERIGTTGRGIGPTYEDRAARCGVRCGDLFDMPALEARLPGTVAQKNLYLRHVLGSDASCDVEALIADLRAIAARLTPFIGNASREIAGAIRAEKRIVFEGAQGTLLDQSFGTVPYVTSSHTLAGAVTVGCGVGPQLIEQVLGVAKAYSTRVGSGPFPTELHGDIGETLRAKGQEFGTVTGRPRRCGWIDTVALKMAVRLNGIQSLAVTKLDVLSGFTKLKVCIGYELKGELLDDEPMTLGEWEQVVPRYIELDGWQEDISSITKWHELPAAARLYLSTIAEIVGVPISIVSVGPERSSTIFLKSAGKIKNFLGEDEPT